jgi:GTP-binding protein
MFIDHIRIQAKAGRGGDGAVSFRREKFIPKGGPDGGDGGKGGDVILRVDPHLDNLTPFFYKPIYKAASGTSGKGQKMYGRSGKDLVVSVPKGTLVYRAFVAPSTHTLASQLAGATEEERNFGVFVSGPEAASAEEEELLDDQDDTELADEEDELLEGEPDGTDEEDVDLDDDLGDDGVEGEEQIEDSADVFGPAGDDDDDVLEEEAVPSAPEPELIADLTEEGQEFVLCNGGKGGRGNFHYKSSRNRTPRQFERGGEGESGTFFLELRRIADVGLVGYPNAGKSTLLGAISGAKPKVAAYPFTTLQPIIGVVNGPDYSTATVADIPGLIEGAHDNVGLGHEFLRHIMRCRALFFVLDMAGSEGRHPAEDLATLREELSLYSPMLVQKPWIVVANKMDLPESAEMLRQFKARFPNREVIEISAGLGEGVEGLKGRMFELLG